MLIPAAMGVEWTSGFDGSIMNGLQSVEAWELSWETKGIDIRDYELDILSRGSLTNADCAMG